MLYLLQQSPGGVEIKRWKRREKKRERVSERDTEPGKLGQCAGRVR